MKRRQLADILRRVEPALSKRDYIPVFTCFCFDGETVTAYDGILTMQAPCPWDIKGGVNGGVLNFLIHRQTEQDVIAVCDGDRVVIKVGQDDDGFGSDLLPQDQFKHSLPDDDGSVAIEIGDLFPDCLRKCSISLGINPAHSWRLGVTLAFTDDRITLYSSDDHSASRAILDRQVPDELVGRSVILAPRFVEALLDADRRDPISTIIIHDNWTKASFDSGLVLLCRGQEDDADADVDRYASVFDSLGADYADTVLVPEGFDDLLTCVDGSVGSPSGDWHGWVWLSIVDGPNGPRVHVEQARKVGGEGPIGSNRVSVHGTTAIGLHDDCRVCAPAALVRRVLCYVKEMAFVDDALLFKGRDFVHLVSVHDDYLPPKPSFRRWAADYISQMFDDCGQPWLPLNESVVKIMFAMKAAGFALRSEETIRLVVRSLGIETVERESSEEEREDCRREGRRPVRYLWWWRSKVQTDDDVEGLDLDLAPSVPGPERVRLSHGA